MKIRDWFIVDYEDALKREMCRKVFHLNEVDLSKKNLDKLAEAVADVCLSKPDYRTIKDFLKNEGNTAKSTKDLFSAFVLDTVDANFDQYVAAKKRKQRTKVMWIVSLLILIVFSGSWFYDRHRSGIQSNYDQDFATINSLNELLNDGWQLDNPDTNYVKIEDGSLRLGTLAGDNWITEDCPEERLIKNLLLREIQCKTCEINVWITGFMPNMRWQQVGVILYEKSEDRFSPYRFIRYTYAYGGPKDSRLGTDHQEILQVLESKSPVPPPFSKNEPIRYNSGVTAPNKRIHNKLRLRINVLEDKYEFQWSDTDRAGQRPILELDRNINPHYLALAAFHGFTYGEDCLPLNADTIFANIDRVSITHFGN